MMQAAVLLSGGIDSTTCLYLAVERYGADAVTAFMMNYGQRHSVEMDHAARSCHKLGVAQREVNIGSVIPRTMLTDSAIQVPNLSYGDIVGVSPTYVPFRNGLMLAAVASTFHGLVIEEEAGTPDSRREREIYFGAHAEDAQAWAYPDCTPEFIGAMANAIFIGTYQKIRLNTPLQWLTKRDIVILGDGLSVAWENTWSCYKGGRIHCGVCPTCRARRNGFIHAGVIDPTVYAETPADL